MNQATNITQAEVTEDKPRTSTDIFVFNYYSNLKTISKRLDKTIAETKVLLEKGKR